MAQGRRRGRRGLRPPPAGPPSPSGAAPSRAAALGRGFGGLRGPRLLKTETSPRQQPGDWAANPLVDFPAPRVDVGCKDEARAR